ncbi:MAG: hypothetical protein V3S07_04820 [Micropepsaceae bacterium]
MIEFIKIVLFSVASAICYGILHDQVTAHLAVEYFTLAHPPVFRTQSPFLLAIGWGILATWWVGLPLATILGVVARSGRRRKLALSDVRPWILYLLGFMAFCALGAGIVGATLFTTGIIPVPGGWGSVLPIEKHAAFTAAAWAHRASYLSGMLGGLFVIAYAFRKRLKSSRARHYPSG